MSQEGNDIHPTAIIGPNVRLGTGNRVGAYCVFEGDVEIGNDNVFAPHVVIGTAPEHAAYWHGVYGGVRIGSNCMVKEFVNIHAGTDATTTIGDRVNVLKGTYVAHDVILEDDVTTSAGVMLGGHVHVMQGCNLGMGGAVHQDTVIGAYSMIGMNAVVSKRSEVRPLGVYVGAPVRRTRENTYAVDKFGIDDAKLAALNARFDALRAALK